MPKYDVRCAQGHLAEIITAWDNRAVPCETCGEPTERVWMTSFPAVHQDSIEGGMTIHNLSATPETFYSKSEHRRRLNELGVQIVDRHVGVPGSDKSPHTRPWF